MHVSNKKLILLKFFCAYTCLSLLTSKTLLVFTMLRAINVKITEKNQTISLHFFHNIK